MRLLFRGEWPEVNWCSDFRDVCGGVAVDSGDDTSFPFSQRKRDGVRADK